MDARARALDLFELWHAELRRLLPADVDVFDVHTHLGSDIDGMTGDYDELEQVMQEFGISRAFFFCLDEPDRHPAFSAANDRTLAFAARSGGRLIPFVRLDLNETPLDEARRCLDAGAKGIKLHPRAQGFTASDERLGPVFELAAERRVPILIHAGRGLPPIAAGLAALVERYPEAPLILAHAGIADLDALATCMRGRKGVFFDTSFWSPLDLLDLYRRIPPEQIVYASDYPYGGQPMSLGIAVKTALRSGYDELRLRAMLAGNANALADGHKLPDPTEPLGSDVLAIPLQLARINQYLSIASPLIWTRQGDGAGLLGLAINTCAERNGHVEATDRIRELLETAHDLAAAAAQIEDDLEARQALRLTGRLIHLAGIEAVTTA